MSTRDDTHLSEAQILQAIVDQGDLPSTVYEHLSRCDLCRADKKRLENRVARMTKMARQLTPQTTKVPSLKRAKHNPARWLPWGWGYGLSAGIMAAAVVIIAFGAFLSHSTRDDTAYLTERATMEDEQFMAEIARLEEDGLPPLYLEISGSSDGNMSEEPADDDPVRGTKIEGIRVPSTDDGRIS